MKAPLWAGFLQLLGFGNNTQSKIIAAYCIRIATRHQGLQREKCLFPICASQRVQTPTTVWKLTGRKPVSSTGQRVPEELLPGLCLTGTAGEVGLNRLRCIGPVFSHKNSIRGVVDDPGRHLTMLLCIYAAVWQQWECTATEIRFGLTAFFSAWHFTDGTHFLLWILMF